MFFFTWCRCSRHCPLCLIGLIVSNSIILIIPRCIFDRSRSPRDRPIKRERRRSGSGDRSRERPNRRGGISERRVQISNIPYEFRWQELKDLFRDEGNINHIKIVLKGGSFLLLECIIVLVVKNWA
jgi:RNA recognition motif. (a.k.a. RRM, RBD, or RNP domain)